MCFICWEGDSHSPSVGDGLQAWKRPWGILGERESHPGVRQHGRGAWVWSGGSRERFLVSRY